jgi:hypothetical protein
VAELPPLVVVQPDLGQRTLAHRVVDEIAMRLTAIGSIVGPTVGHILRDIEVRLELSLVREGVSANAVQHAQRG